MLVLHQVVTDPRVCAYLPNRMATLEYSFVKRMDPREYEDLMNHGCRKFGPAVFRPVCKHCQACRPIRIPVDRFRPNRSQRRAWNANFVRQPLEVRLGEPTVDAARLDLYNRYHEAQTLRKGWEIHQADPDQYEFSFVRGPIPALEMSLWEHVKAEGGRQKAEGRLQKAEGRMQKAEGGAVLRAVIIADVTPNVVSAVYHYYEPAPPAPLRHGLGTYCLLQTIELARRLGKRWVYLGFYVAGCPSMVYKASFRPCEIMGVDGVWREADGDRVIR